MFFRCETKTVSLALFWGTVFILSILAKTAFATGIDFEVCLGKAMSGAIELKIAAVDENISNASRLEATAKFFPQIYAKYAVNYNHDFGNKSGMTSIGGQYYPDSTAWDSSFGVNFQYDFFNFFTDFNAYRYASKSYEAQKYQTKSTRRNIAVAITDIYEQVLINYYGMKYYELLSKYALELYEVQKRLYDTGLANKQLYYLAGAEAADYQIQKLNYEKSLSEALEQLSYYTEEAYSVADIPADFILDDSYEKAPTYEKYPEYNSALIKLEQKNLEINILRGSFFPRFSFYGGVNFLGKDRSAVDRAIGDIEAVNYTLGIAASLNIFDGFSSIHAYSRLKAEKYKLELEKLQIIKKIGIENTRLANAKEYLKMSDSQSKLATDYSNTIFNLNETMRGVNLTGAADILSQRIETLKKLQEEKTVSIRFSAEVKRLEIVNKYI